MKRAIYTGSLCVAVLVFCALVAAAQASSTRTVRGQVLDENEKPVERAVVHLTNLGTKKKLSVVTDKEGRYQFNDVSRKTDFEVVAELGERKSRTRKVSQFDSRALVFAHLKLEPPRKEEGAGESKKSDEDD